METKRLFISIPVDPIVSKDIFKKFNSLNLPWEKLKKVDVEQLHLTLKFLGEVPIDKIPEVLSSLNKVQLNIKDLDINIKQSQIFNAKQPRALVLSLEENKDLQELYNIIEQTLFDDGLAHKEVRKFSTHLTLARVKKTSDFQEFEEFLNWPIKKSFFVSYFELAESELSKAGPEYTSLQTFDL